MQPPGSVGVVDSLVTTSMPSSEPPWIELGRQLVSRGSVASICPLGPPPEIAWSSPERVLSLL